MAVKKKRRVWPLLLLFIIGLSIFSYPFLSDYYYRVEFTNEIASFGQGISELEAAEIKERIELAQAYNNVLNNKITNDPFDTEQLTAGIKEYARMLEVREKIGFIEIPAIDVELPIFAGTSDEVLEKGLGHLEGTSLPIGGNSTHTVITGHSGLPKAKLFTDLHDLAIGHKFYIHNISEVLAYQVDYIETIEPTDFSKLMIEPGHDYVTLLTCTPIGINSHRLIVRGHRIEYFAPVEEKAIAEHKASKRFEKMFYIAAAVAGILLLTLINLAFKYRKLKIMHSTITNTLAKAEQTDNKSTSE